MESWVWIPLLTHHFSPPPKFLHKGIDLSSLHKKKIFWGRCAPVGMQQDPLSILSVWKREDGRRDCQNLEPLQKKRQRHRGRDARETGSKARTQTIVGSPGSSERSVKKEGGVVSGLPGELQCEESTRGSHYPNPIQVHDKASSWRLKDRCEVGRN